MTNRTEEPIVRQRSSGRVIAPARLDGEWSIRGASVTAGVGLLLMSGLAGFGKVFALDGLVTQGNATQTAKDIMQSMGLFRLSIVSLILVVTLDVLIAVALYRVFSPVNKSISLLAAAFRLTYAGVFLVAIGQLVGVARLLGTNATPAAFSTDQVNAQALSGVNAFNDVWYAGQFLFGLHLLAIGYLAYRSGYVPRFLGVLLAIAGIGYAIDSLAAVLAAPGSWSNISSFTFIGEFLLALWLVIWGRRLTVGASVPRQNPVAAAR
jgi:Domain of unknown function (DUF4386)